MRKGGRPPWLCIFESLVRAFSSEADTASREQNARTKRLQPRFWFHHPKLWEWCRKHGIAGAHCGCDATV